MDGSVDNSLGRQRSPKPRIEKAHRAAGAVAMGAVHIKVGTHSMLDRRGRIVNRAGFDEVRQLGGGERAVKHPERIESGKLVRGAARGFVVKIPVERAGLHAERLAGRGGVALHAIGARRIVPAAAFSATVRQGHRKILALAGG